MSSLEKATHVSLIAVSVLAGVALLRQQFLPNSPPVEPPQLKGKHLSLPGLTIAKGMTLVVALRSDCRFCAESLPFYRELGQNRRDVSLLFISSEPSETLRRFIATAGVPFDGIATVDLRGFGITLTPTLAILDRNGTVKMAFYGKLSGRDADAVRASVGRGVI